MKTIQIFTTLALSTLLGTAALAQSGQTFNESDINNFLQAASSDASKLIGAYVSPVIKGVSYGMTSGWYHTGKTHKKLGIDFGVTISGVMLPSSEQTFDPFALGLSANTQPQISPAPTIIGPKDASSYYVKYNSTSPSITVNGPQGLDFKKNLGGNWIPVPMFQAGIGLIKNTDLKIRFVPDTKIGDSRVKMLGFGLMHDIKQYFPGVKRLPFDLSILVAYNSVSGSTGLVNLDQSNDGKPYSPDGKLAYTLNSWISQLIISKKVAVFTFYAGAGYAAVNSKVNINGSFTLDPYANGLTITNPFATTYANNGTKLTAGMRLKLGPIYFNGDYSIQKYNALTVGVGASIR